MPDAARSACRIVGGMNGVSANMQVIEIRPWWKNALVAADVVFGVLAAGSIFMLVKTIKKGKKDAATTES